MALTVDNLRTKQWDKSNLWDVDIQGITFGGAKWLPANDVELVFHGIENGTLGDSGVEFAQKASHPSITMSYLDDENLSMTHSIRQWQEHIVSHDGIYVKPIESAGVLKHFTLKKLNHKRETVTTVNAMVYPSGSLNYHGDSDGSTPIYSVAFTVVKMGFE